MLWIGSKPRPNEPNSLLWTNNDYTNEIKLLPTSELKFKGDMLKKCRKNSRKRHYNKLRTIEQLYSRKYVPTTTITPSVGRKYQGNMVVVEKKIDFFFKNGELLTMPMNKQPPF